MEYVLIKQEAPKKLTEKNNGRRYIPIDEFSWKNYRSNTEFMVILRNLDMDGGGKTAMF